MQKDENEMTSYTKPWVTIPAAGYISSMARAATMMRRFDTAAAARKYASSRAGRVVAYDPDGYLGAWTLGHDLVPWYRNPGC